MKLDWPALRPRLLYGAFALLAFLLALRWTFPSEAVRERLIYEAGSRGWQIEFRDVGPSGLMGVRMDGVVLTDRSGLAITVDRMRASLRLLPLVIGKSVLDYRTSIYDGTVEGRADLSGQDRRIVVEIDGLDLARANPLRKAVGIDLSGKATGRLDLTLPGGALEKANGSLELAVERAGAAGGPVPMPLAIGTVSAAARIEQGRVAVEKLEARGGDVEVTGEGVALVLQQRLQYAPLTGQAHVRFQPALWQKPEAASLRPLVESNLVSSRSPDGTYLFQVTGNLGHPTLVPAPPGSGGQKQGTP
jgi:type II secretion system protein N